MLNIAIINNGYLVVDLFFVLSGYGIHSAYTGKIMNKIDLFRFQFLRFWRLYPVHLLFLVVFIFIEIAKYIAQSEFGIQSLNTYPFRENNLTAIFEQLFLVQAIGPKSNATTFNFPAWSISVEFYTYLVFGMFILFIEKKKNFLFFIIAIASLTFLVTETTFGFNDLFRCLAGFFIDFLTALVTKVLKINIPKYASLLAFVSIVFFLQFKSTPQYDVAIYFLTAALIASLVLSKNGYLNYVLNLKALTCLGSISYAYMSHASRIWVINQFVRVILKKPEILIYKKSIPQLNSIETLIACGLIIIAVMAVSYFVYRFIEKPMREKSRLYAFQALR